MRCFIILLAAALLLTTPLNAATPTTVPATILAIHNPPHAAVEATPDGNALILYQPYIETIDLWHALTTHWPEIAAAITLLLMLLTLRSAIRAARRAEINGQPHCHLCRYCLAGITSDRCPECGNLLEKRGVIRGRPRLQRLLPHIAFALLLTSACIAAFLTIPRETALSRRFE